MKTGPWRLGATSYVVPDTLLANVRHLARTVDDIELVLFEIDDGPHNLPATPDVASLRMLAERHDLTYTVHLPLDLRLGASGDTQHASLIKARRVIECTRDLEPWAYVLHLDGREERQGTSASTLTAWCNQAVHSLEIVAGWAGSAARLAVENLEGYPPDFNLPVLERIDAGVCVDIGHLWLDGHDPIPLLRSMLPRTRVVHLHGVGSRDHQSLMHTPPHQLDAVIDWIDGSGYAGVLTLEVFGEEDFNSSLAALAAARKRLRATRMAP